MRRLGVSVAFTLLVISLLLSVLRIQPVKAGLIDTLPILTIENNTHLLPIESTFFNTTMNGTFMIGQIDWSQGQPIWSWQETHKNIVAPPGGLIGEHPIVLEHEIDESLNLTYGFTARMINETSIIVGNAYAFEEGETPPEVEPPGGLIGEYPLADPRPTPIVLYAYASPPVEVGVGSVSLLYHNVAVSDVAPSKDVVGQDYVVPINVTVENQGNFIETFNVTLTVSKPNIGVINFDLYGSASEGWGFSPPAITSPGPTITVNQSNLVNLTLTSQDGIRHNFFVDYDGDTNPSVGEPKSPDFKSTSINFQFTADTDGTFIVNPPAMLTTEIGRQEITVENGTSTTLFFDWNTTGFDKGNYSITAIADTVVDDLNATDNTFVNGWIFVSIPGDVDADFDVDIFDIVKIAGSYGSSKPDLSYDPISDIDGDGDIDIFDVVIAASHYGETYP